MKRQALQSERVPVPGLSRNEPQVITLTTIEKEVKSNKITLKIAATEKKKDSEMSGQL